MLVGLIGCSEQSFNSVETVKEIPNPDIEITPMLLDFGEVTSGEQVLRTFSVTNEGASPLHVTDLELVTAGPFTILTPESDFEFLLDPGGVREFEVVFEPAQAMDATGEITVFSDDWDEAESIVETVAYAATPSW